MTFFFPHRRRVFTYFTTVSGPKRAPVHTKVWQKHLTGPVMPARTMGIHQLCASSDSDTAYIYIYILGGVYVLHIMYIYGVLLPLRSVRARLFFSIEKT